MKRKNFFPGMSLFSPAFVIHFTILFFAISFSYAQEKNLVQVKTFDQQLNPLPNLSISVNDNDFSLTDNKGVCFIELEDTDLPPKTIRIKSDELEAESWNYSKGILEIIVRKKSYKIEEIRLVTVQNKPVRNVTVKFHGKETITAVTDIDGMFKIPLGVTEKITNKEQFEIKAYTITNLIFRNKLKTIFVEPIKANSDNNKEPAYFKNFDLKNLDSIQSLTVFYAVFKNYPLGSLDDDMKRKIDDKFKDLLARVTSPAESQQRFIGKISDSSFVSSDIQNLLAQAKTESTDLDLWRKEFNHKIEIINKKLARGVQNIDQNARKRILSEIDMLEAVLAQNERKFYKNLTDYQGILGSLREKLSDVNNLNKKLFISERSRLQEQALFQKRLTIIIALTASFSLLAIVFIYFSITQKKQKKELMKANASVKKLNETLEGIVQERTKSLQDANEEMDSFLYRASHNLRGPILTIQGLCYVAKKIKDNESNELFQRTSLIASKMDRMLMKLQLISEVYQPNQYASINLLTSINALLTSNRPPNYDQVSMLLDVKGDVVFMSYPRLIEIIFSNLLENAYFYCGIKNDPHAEIKISARQDDNSVKITVWDNGTGIDQNVISKIWDMFYIGDTHSQGNGLGLYIVLKAVKAAHGNITVKSEVNVFTEFEITIPNKKEPTAEKTTAAS